jgi:hypothetical protein
VVRLAPSNLLAGDARGQLLVLLAALSVAPVGPRGSTVDVAGVAPVDRAGTGVDTAVAAAVAGDEGRTGTATAGPPESSVPDPESESVTRGMLLGIRSRVESTSHTTVEGSADDSDAERARSDRRGERA